MTRIEIEKLSGGWLITVTNDDRVIIREFETDEKKAQAIAWTAIIEEFE